MVSISATIGVTFGVNPRQTRKKINNENNRSLTKGLALKNFKREREN